MFNEVDKYLRSPDHKIYVSSITGMLIDLNVFTTEQIIQMLKDPNELRERIEEAKNLIEEEL